MALKRQSLAKKLLKARKALSPFDAGFKKGMQEMQRRYKETEDYRKNKQAGDGFIGMSKRIKSRRKSYT